MTMTTTTTQIRGGGIAAALFCLVCLLHFGTTPPMAFAAERKLLLVEQSLISTTAQKNGTHHSTGTTPPPPPPPPTNTTWCVVKPSTSMEKLDDIIDYCCTQPGVDCSVIQPKGMCYLPPNKVSDASVVMNIFYKLHGKNDFNCDFKKSGLIVTEDPSVGRCIYPA